MGRIAQLCREIGISADQLGLTLGIVEKWSIDASEFVRGQQFLQVGMNPRAMGRFVTVNGRRVHVSRAGFGRRVVLLHADSSLCGNFLPLCSIVPEWRELRRIDPATASAIRSRKDSMVRFGNRTGQLLDGLGTGMEIIVAPSLVAGGASYLASRHPERVLSLTLIRPVCRPAPHRRMCGFRPAVFPVPGRNVRALLPQVASRLRRRILTSRTAPYPVRKSLEGIPVSHAAKPLAVLTAAAELRPLDKGMLRADPRVDASLPAVAMSGTDDQTAICGGHVPWLQDHIGRLDLLFLRAHGRLLHQIKVVSIAFCVC